MPQDALTRRVALKVAVSNSIAGNCASRVGTEGVVSMPCIRGAVKTFAMSLPL
jgi:hypothetical protein